jgi:hypothetical protein
MSRYLVNIAAKDVAAFEKMLGGGMAVVSIGEGVPIASVDAVFDDELTAVDSRLASSGPRYHGPGPLGDLLAGDQPPDKSDTMLHVDGRPFRCRCRSNVFRRQAALSTKSGTVYTCNGCGEQYAADLLAGDQS